MEYTARVNAKSSYARSNPYSSFITELIMGPVAFPISVDMTKALEIIFKRKGGKSSLVSDIESIMSGNTGIETIGAAIPIMIKPPNIMLALCSIPKIGDVPIKAIETESSKSPMKTTTVLVSLPVSQNIKGQISK